jgi:hypothetical protein
MNKGEQKIETDAKRNRRSWRLGLALAFLLIAVAVGSFIRYVNLFNLGFFFDTVVTQYDWASNALDLGIVGFWRDFPGFFDYLPGALYLLTVIRWIASFFGGSAETFVAILKSVNWGADLFFIGLLVYVGRRYGRYTLAQLLAMAGVIYVLPAIWVVSQVWGQIDTLLVSLMILTVILLYKGLEDNSVHKAFYKNPVFYSGVVFALALWLKLQAALLIPVFILFYLCIWDRRVFINQLSGFMVTSLLMVGMPLLVNATRLGQNLVMPYLRGDQVSRRAATFWGLIGFTGSGSDPVFTVNSFSLSVSIMGMVLYAALMVIFVIKYLNIDVRKLLRVREWGSVFPSEFTFFDFTLIMTLSSSLYFMLFTKMHSRYLHVGLLFAMVTLMATALKRRALPWLFATLILSFSYFLNQIYVYVIDDVAGPAWIRDVYNTYHVNVFLLASLLNLLCISGMYIWGWYARRNVPLKEIKQYPLTEM